MPLPDWRKRGASVGDLLTRPVSDPINNHLLCDGSAVLRTGFPQLFDAIGTAWGAGDGSTTFNIPNLLGTAIPNAITAPAQTITDTTVSAGGTITQPSTPARPAARTAATSSAAVATGSRISRDLSRLPRRVCAAMDPDFHRIEELDAKVANGSALFWFTDKSAVAGEVQRYPNALVLHCLCATGDMNEIVNELAPQAEEWATAGGVYARHRRKPRRLGASAETTRIRRAYRNAGEETVMGLSKSKSTSTQTTAPSHLFRAVYQRRGKRAEAGVRRGDGEQRHAHAEDQCRARLFAGRDGRELSQRQPAPSGR
jgi:microcystin-dependent protein